MRVKKDGTLKNSDGGLDRLLLARVETSRPIPGFQGCAHLSPGSGHQLVHRVSDLLPMVRKRVDHGTELIGSHGYHLQGIEDDFDITDAEDGIHSRARN